MYRDRTMSYIRKRKKKRNSLFFCVNNRSSRLNYFPPFSPFNSVYLTFSLPFGAGRAIIGNSASRDHEDPRQEVRLLFTEKQLRKRRYLRRLHSNLIIPVLPFLSHREHLRFLRPARKSHAFYIPHNFET